MYDYSSRRRLAECGCWLAIFLLLGVMAAAVLVADLAGVRTRLVAAVGDERRHEITALTSSLTARKVETADMVPIRHVGVNSIGVNTFLEQEAEIPKRRQTMQMIKEAGIGWIRQQFPWEDIERPTKGMFWDEKYGYSSWNKYDNMVDLANEYGIQMIVRLDLPPKWTHPDNTWPHTPPDSFEDYGNFVYKVVSRYRGKIKYYQLWNEPNLSTEWGGQPVDAKEYVRLLKIGYQRAKEADPNCVIISGALAPTIEESWRALNDQIYLQQMYDAGAKDYFDILSVMAYGLRSGPDDRRLTVKDVNFSRPLLIREIMVKNGDSAKPIWASEMGWNAQPESVTAEPVFGRVSEQLQARYAVRGFQRAAEEWPWMGVMNLWFFKRAGDQEKDQPFYYFRMVEPDFATHPVYDAVKALGSSEPLLRRGYSQESHWALQYQGGWTEVDEPRASLGGMRRAGQAGATITTMFQGTELALVVPRGPGLGHAYVEIDGSPEGANLLPRDEAGRAFVDLSGPARLWQQQLPVAAGLPMGAHRLKITTAGTFALDGLIVDAPMPVSPAERIAQLLPYLAAGAIVILTGMVMTLRLQSRNRGRLRI
ncbi:MAG: cellulase family glycosylhydrolase [Chloroflexota bacterium]